MTLLISNSDNTVEQLQRVLSGEVKEIIQGHFHKDLAGRIVCRDGTTLSVQASEYHYSLPRENYGPYSHVEVGFPSVAPTGKFLEYAEDFTEPTGTVYGYVPIEIVAAFIDEHGGIGAEEVIDGM